MVVYGYQAVLDDDESILKIQPTSPKQYDYRDRKTPFKVTETKIFLSPTKKRTSSGTSATSARGRTSETESPSPPISPQKTKKSSYVMSPVSPRKNNIGTSERRSTPKSPVTKASTVPQHFSQVDPVSPNNSIKNTQETTTHINSKNEPYDRLVRVYSWYGRLGQPDKAKFVDRIKRLDQADVTVHDIELLPWLLRGKLVNVAKMNRIIREGHL